MQAVGWEFKRARNLLARILRDPRYDNASCFAWVAGLVAIFLLQVEPLLWRRGIFTILKTYEGQWPLELHPLSGFWLFPFEETPPALKTHLWLPAAIVYLINAVLLDRFVARHGGDDVSWRPLILRLRGLLAGIPLLGLCVIPLWRALYNRKPAWACRHRAPRLVLGELQDDLPGGPASRFPQGGAALHSTLFFFWLLAASLLALRAFLAWLNEPERATTTTLLILQGICGALRIGGMICIIVYVKLRGRQGALRGKRKWGLLACSAAWLLPQSFLLLPIAALLLLGERWGTAIGDMRVQSNLEREAYQAIDSKLFAVGRPLQSVVLDKAALKVLRLYREKTFLLMTEVASILMLVLPLRAQLPWLNLPGCLMALLYLTALLSLPVVAVFYVRSLLRMFSGSAELAKGQVEHPFVRYLLLTSLAVVAGFNLGALAGFRKLDALGFLFFWIGVYGSTIGFGVAFWGLKKINEKSLFLWPMLFMCIGMTGHQMRQGSFDINVLGVSRHVENAAQFHLFKLYLMIPLVFLLTVFLGLYRCRWLPRPFRVKDIFSPDLPARVRRQLAFLVLTAWLPLSGALVPIWIRLRVGLAGEAGEGKGDQAGTSPAPTTAFSG